MDTRHEAPRPPLREDGRIPAAAAALVAGGALLLSGLISQRTSPDPSHPRIRRWYKSLDTPSYKPPDAVFGGVWPVLETLLSVGAYRLMRRPRSPERDQALALWALALALTTGYGQTFFGNRSLTGASIEGAALVAVAAAFIERASRVDGVAAATAVPFALWTSFGEVLTEDIRERNPDLDGRDPPP